MIYYTRSVGRVDGGGCNRAERALLGEARGPLITPSPPIKSFPIKSP